MNLKSTIYRDIFSDAWTMMSKAYPPRQTEAYWQDLYKAVKAVADKYSSTDYQTFVNDLMTAIGAELERLDKAQSIKSAS